MRSRLASAALAEAEQQLRQQQQRGVHEDGADQDAQQQQQNAVAVAKELKDLHELVICAVRALVGHMKSDSRQF